MPGSIPPPELREDVEELAVDVSELVEVGEEVDDLFAAPLPSSTSPFRLWLYSDRVEVGRDVGWSSTSSSASSLFKMRSRKLIADLLAEHLESPGGDQ